MKKSDPFVDFVLDQLRSLPGVRSRRMFGGHGLYAKDDFFGVIAAGCLYFKTNEKTRQRYVDVGMEPFEPNPGQVLKNYFKVPVDVLEDDDALAEWARESVRVAKG
jgi:DNA transformation protein